MLLGAGLPLLLLLACGTVANMPQTETRKCLSIGVHLPAVLGSLMPSCEQAWAGLPEDGRPGYKNSHDLEEIWEGICVVVFFKLYFRKQSPQGRAVWKH